MSDIHPTTPAAEVIRDQPTRYEPPSPTRDADIDLSHTAGKLPKWSTVQEALTTRTGWLGDYDYTFLCMPSLPGLARHRPPPFYGIKDRLPLLMAIVMGFQHTLAMIAGVVTPAIIMSGTGPNGLNLPPDMRTQMISTSLITSGVLSLIQITRFRLIRGYYLGTGLLSVLGTSFIFLPVLQSMVGNMYKTGYCESSMNEDGSTLYHPCPKAWGAYVGTCMLCSFLPICFSFMPPKVLKRLFPSVVTGVTIVLIGAKLITSGMTQWAGGSGPCAAMPKTGMFVNCPNNLAPNAAPWGSGQWIGLGFLVFTTILLVEFFGSPFMRNAQVVIGLVVGFIVAIACGYTTSDSLAAAPTVTFLWVKTYPISIYPPAIIPLLITYTLAMVESIGDITASCEVSRQPVEGREFESRLQGGILADGISGFLASCFFNSPMSCFAQNNGIIALTRCANTMAGYMCCFFLILMGVFSKFGALFLTVPDAVLGGMTTFLFANVLVSGVRILSFLKWTRRDRFIVASSFVFGFGAALVKDVFTKMVTYTGSSTFVSSLADSAKIVLSSGFCLGAMIAMVLNLLLPEDNGVDDGDDDNSSVPSSSNEMPEMEEGSIGKVTYETKQ
ncbi:hypothetical protein BGW41_008118 [Actinomortierella wolfii]|nr:hypothetical protein BGW41_008118 [Actinomortierella wolfii]